ncbi:MAG: hypothetical protein PHN51_11870 [Candidatus Nanopelagicales bacterium]|nr:hypothetical protein [Candidatus Nanopelagicales bacterium]
MTVAITASEALTILVCVRQTMHHMSPVTLSAILIALDTLENWRVKRDKDLTRFKAFAPSAYEKYVVLLRTVRKEASRVDMATGVGFAASVFGNAFTRRVQRRMVSEVQLDNQLSELDTQEAAVSDNEVASMLTSIFKHSDN